MITTTNEVPKINDWQAVFDYLLKLKNNPLHRYLLFGLSGSGKSTLAASLHPQAIRKELSEGMFSDVLYGKFLLVNGSTQWINGVATEAATKENGVPLILEEIDKMGSELISPMHQILDDRSICRWTLDNGSTVTPKENYQVIATMNPHPSILPEQVLERFDIILRCDTPNAGIFRRITPDKASYLKNKYMNTPTSEPFIPKQSPRNFIRWQQLENAGVPSEFACQLIFGEDQAEAIQNGCIDAMRNSQPIR
jgi:MoxR-like ATPase